jgi:outer membrane protein
MRGLHGGQALNYRQIGAIVLFVPFAMLLMASTGAAQSAEFKIGFVDHERVLREAAPAVKAQKKIEQEFSKRDQELQQLSKQLKEAQDTLEKSSAGLTDADRKNKEREFADLNREFQRKQREFREDLNQRRNEELASVLERENRAINQIADAEKFDLVLQEAVYRSPRIDITDKVIKALADPPAK